MNVKISILTLLAWHQSESNVSLWEDKKYSTVVIGSIRKAFSGFVRAKIIAIIQRKDSPVELPNLYYFVFVAVDLFLPHAQAGYGKLIAEGTAARVVCKGFVSRRVIL